MDPAEEDRLKDRLARRKRLLLQTVDAAAAAIISEDIAEIEARLRDAADSTKKDAS